MTEEVYHSLTLACQQWLKSGKGGLALRHAKEGWL